MDNDAIRDIERIIELKKGDAGRLNHIKNMLQKDRPLYVSDSRYFEALRKKYLTADTVQEAQVISQVVKPSIDRPRGRKRITDDPPKSSPAWYVLPVFLSIIGGMISYLCLRVNNHRRARNTLIVGSVLFALQLTLVLGVLGYVYAEIDVVPTSLTPEQIKQRAVTVPDHLDPYMYTYGLYSIMVQYEGQIIDIAPIFDSYILLVEIQSDSSENFVIRSNFEPQTIEAKAWIEDLDRNLNSLDSDDTHVKIWGVVQGNDYIVSCFNSSISWILSTVCAEYDTILSQRLGLGKNLEQSMIIQEVDVYLLERFS